MHRTLPSSALARRALELVEDLQRRYVDRLQAVSRAVGRESRFAPVEWLRDDGRHGGGVRWGTGGDGVYDQASINVSCVHYDDEPGRKLASATALSAIVHPAHPRAPSAHLHVSWTAQRDPDGERGYWRVMADLNPSIPDDADRDAFSDALRAAAPALYDEGAAQGDRYFFIPALGRHRGVSHFYLEGVDSGDWEADRDLARRIEEATIDTYTALVRRALLAAGPPTDAERAAQLAYHTAYLFQVCTLDRGTTSGLLIHDQNDEGILGSLPSHVDRALLASWEGRVPAPQDALVRALVAALPERSPAPVDGPVRRALAAVIRAHYRAHPEALELQARGDVVPPTVDNHLGRAGR